MADIPDTDPFKGLPNGYSFSFTQSYPGYTWPETDPQIAVTNELARLDFLEQQVQEMLTYPDAERIIKHIQENL